MLDHVNIVVRDIERSAAFYTQALGLRRGFERILEGPWIEALTGLREVRAQCLFLESPAGGARLELLRFLAPSSLILEAHGCPNAIGVRHIAWQVADVDEVAARLRQAGAELLCEPVEVPFEVASLGRKRLCYARDPDGVLIEIASYRRGPAALAASDC